MKPNMGKVDRSIRAVLGLLLVASGLYYDMWFWAVGVVFLLTAAFRWCPLYRLLGVNTCEVRSKG
jgi:hypothetical protein